MHEEVGEVVGNEEEEEEAAYDWDAEGAATEGEDVEEEEAFCHLRLMLSNLRHIPPRFRFRRDFKIGVDSSSASASTST